MALDFKDLTSRLITAIILGGVVIYFTLSGGIGFMVLFSIMLFIALFEWIEISHNLKPRKIWLFSGALYILVCTSSIVLLREINQPREDTGMFLTIWLFGVVWATDIGAYIAGRTIGGPKLIPSISPKKTWAGLGGGIVAAVIVSIPLSKLAQTPVVPHMYLAAFMAIISQCGDFLESWVKRKAKVKDSGSILPGHGGILDRVDGLLFAAPFAYLLWYLRG